jgi:cell division protein FtsW (lipid II flippase)
MKNTLLLFGMILAGLLIVDQFGSKKYCSYSCLQNYDGIALNWLVIFGMSFLMLVIVYFLPYQAYQRWWKFARIAISLILIISTLINLGFHHNPGGFMNMDDMFDIPAHILLYTIFVVGSIVQIVRGLKSSD